MSAVFHVDPLKPLAIDLYCGLASAQPQLLLRTDATVEQLVTRRAKYPHHVSLCIRCQSPCAISFEFRFVGYLKNSRLAACLASGWHFWIAALQSIQRSIFERTLGFVLLASFWVFATRPFLSKFPRRLLGASRGAVSPIAVRWLNGEMCSASQTISTSLGGALVFFSADSPCALGAVVAAPFFVWSYSFEWCGAPNTGEIMHCWNIA